jgi:hypothetical protein
MKTTFALVERKNGMGTVYCIGTIMDCMKKQAEIHLDRPVYVVWKG